MQSGREHFDHGTLERFFVLIFDPTRTRLSVPAPPFISSVLTVQYVRFAVSFPVAKVSEIFVAFTLTNVTESFVAGVPEIGRAHV